MEKDDDLSRVDDSKKENDKKNVKEESNKDSKLDKVYLYIIVCRIILSF